MNNAATPAEPTHSQAKRTSKASARAADTGQSEKAGTGSPRKANTTRNFTANYLLSLAIGLFLWGYLIYYAGLWNILANTRILDLLIKAGVIAYTDADAGFVTGVPSHEYFLRSQSLIEWWVVAMAIGLFFVFWALKALQFHALGRYHGIPGTFGQHSRSYIFGLGYKMLFPFQIGESASAAALRTNGATLPQAYSLTFLANIFVWFEIAVFALYGLYSMGWADWFLQILMSLILGVIIYRLVRGDATSEPRVSAWAAIRGHWQQLSQRPGQLIWISLLSLLAFGLEDIAAYFIAMGFTSQSVILNVDFSLLLMGVVGGYIARMIAVTPGAIGQFEWGFAMALYVGGLGFPEAATIAILDNLIRYSAFAVIWLVNVFWKGAPTGFSQVIDLAYDPLPDGKPDWSVPSPTEGSLTSVPAVPIPDIPQPLTFWMRVQKVVWVLLVLYLLDKLTILMGNFWLMQSLGYESVFWTNFRMGASLFVAAFLLWTVGVGAAGWLHPISGRARSFVTQLGMQLGLIAGYALSLEYMNYLLFTGKEFNKVDSVFGYDISFYFFTLPTINTTWSMIFWWFFCVLGVSIGCAYAAKLHTQSVSRASAVHSRLWQWIGAVSTPYTLFALVGWGLTIAVGIWLERFDLLYKDNSSSSVGVGADYLDVTGLISTLNYYYVTVGVVVIMTVALALLFRSWRREYVTGKQMPQRMRYALNIVLLIALVDVTDLAFAGGLYLRDRWFVRPNEPVVQLAYIQQHIDATRAAYHLEDIQEIEFTPNGPGDPLPSLDDLLNNPTIKNVPLWPAYSNYLESVIDPEYTQRIFQTNGDMMIYGPTLETFRQQQKLRTYYDFLSVDPLRFEIDGETKMMASAVREIPLMEPQPWLAWWGQRFVLFTHGYGLVMAPVSETTPDGGPNYISDSIPVQTAYPDLKPGNDRVYYGEGASSVAFSNIRNLPEFDYPTEQGRAESTIAAGDNIGSPMDSVWKRLVFGWRSGYFWEMLFSGLITPDTRIHFLRTPMERLNAVAPFLWFDNNSYAVPTSEDIVWLVNGLSYSDKYPYSHFRELGDKSVGRWINPTPWVWANYIEDSVKATVNAHTGEVKLYKISDDPMIETFASLYPDLFVDDATMPEDVRKQLTYPLHLFHYQFDDAYIYYHMKDAVYYFNMEDMWDDGDEVLGPILDQGGAINFSIEPYHLLLETGGVLPEADKKTQFTMMAVFTPENALNLRGIPFVYQDGEDYGKLAVLQVPKGHYSIGPEQADATIDQDPTISQLITWLNRRGADVIRGHTTTLVVGNEVIYVEPLFIRSQQNPVPQLQRVTVIFRGQPYMAETLEGALRAALEGAERQMAATQ
jgi:uncharacterized membrane protein (UPF0182 family)